MKFESNELQMQWDAYQAKMNSPEVVAQEKLLLIEARKNFWGSILFLLPVTSLAVNLAFMWVLVHIFHTDQDPLVWVGAIGLPVFIGMALYPRN